MLPVPGRSSTAVDCVQCTRTAGGRGRGDVTHIHALRTLAVIWLHPTRLETRTKESSLCASLRVRETRRRNESEGALRRAEVRTRRVPFHRGARRAHH